MTFVRKASVVFLVVACVFMTTAASTLAQTKSKARKSADAANYRVPERKWAEVSRGGRKFIVEQELLDRDPALAKKALARLKTNIDLALQILPEHAQPHVAKQQFWLLYGSKAKGGGKDSGLAYFRPGSPKFNKNRHKDWNSAVVVYSAKNYTKLTDLWALKSVLHELAHAYQLEQWPEKEPSILAAYENAMADGLYKNVPNNKGGSFESAYAAQNQLEYFAEVSCMFFAQCNYRPYNRAELKTIDPTGHRMIRKMWKIGDENGEHEQRTWRIGRSERPLVATFDSMTGKSVALIDEKGRKKKIAAKTLSLVDQDYIKRWFEQ